MVSLKQNYKELTVTVRVEEEEEDVVVLIIA